VVAVRMAIICVRGEERMGGMITIMEVGG
jgi:hypothetical protein